MTPKPELQKVDSQTLLRLQRSITENRNLRGVVDSSVRTSIEDELRKRGVRT